MLTNQPQTETTQLISSAELMSAALANGEKAYSYILQAQLSANTNERAIFLKEAAELIEIVKQNKKEVQRIRLIESEEAKKKQQEFSTI